MKQFIKDYWVLAVLYIALAVTIVATGCKIQPPANSDGTTHNFTKTPASLHATSVNLDWLIFIGIVVLAVGVATYFALPEFHKVSGLLVYGGGSTLGISLFLKTTLWLISWISGGLVVIGFIVLVYEIYLKVEANAAPTH